MDSPWMGNVRELANVLERAVLLTREKNITLDSLSLQDSEQDSADGKPALLKETLELAENQAIRQALAIAEGNRTKAALILGIGRRTLYEKIAAYSLEER